MRRVGVYPPLPLRRFGVRLLNAWSWRVSPPGRFAVFGWKSIYDIRCIYYYRSGRNKYLKISESRQMRLASQTILRCCLEREGSVKGVKAKIQLSQSYIGFLYLGVLVFAFTPFTPSRFSFFLFSFFLFLLNHIKLKI